MAKRAKNVESGGSVEGAIGGFAEDLGRILGQARSKADRWLGQRQAIVKQLTQLRDEASGLLTQPGNQAPAAGQLGAESLTHLSRAIRSVDPADLRAPRTGKGPSSLAARGRAGGCQPRLVRRF